MVQECQSAKVLDVTLNATAPAANSVLGTFEVGNP